MTKVTSKNNKKEEQKKLIVRIVCMTLVVALAVTSLLTMFPSLFQDDTAQTYTIEDLVAMGLIEIDEEGNIVFTDDSMFEVTESGEEHDHE